MSVKTIFCSAEHRESAVEAQHNCCRQWLCAMHYAQHRQAVHPEPGLKYDKDKPRYDLIPFKALAEVVDVLTYGAKKYAPENWRLVDGWRWRYFGAAMRHLVAWFGGEKVDPESGHKHLAHAVCCLMFAIELDQ